MSLRETELLSGASSFMSQAHAVARLADSLLPALLQAAQEGARTVQPDHTVVLSIEDRVCLHVYEERWVRAVEVARNEVTVCCGRDRVLRALRACPRNAFLPAPHNRPPEAFVDQPVRTVRSWLCCVRCKLGAVLSMLLCSPWPHPVPGSQCGAGQLQAGYRLCHLITAMHAYKVDVNLCALLCQECLA